MTGGVLLKGGMGPAPSLISLLLPGREVDSFALSHACSGVFPHYRPKVDRDNQ